MCPSPTRCVNVIHAAGTARIRRGLLDRIRGSLEVDRHATVGVTAFLFDAAGIVRAAQTFWSEKDEGK
jgi:hypothetical protein